LGAGVIALALVYVDALGGVLGVGLEAVSAMAVVPTTLHIRTEVLAPAIVAVGVTGPALGALGTAHLVRSVPAVVVPVTGHSGINALPVGTLELVGGAVAVLGEGAAHGEVLVGEVRLTTVGEPVAELEDVEAETGVGTAEAEWRVAASRLALLIGLVAVVPAVVVPVAHEFARDAHRVGALELVGAGNGMGY